MMKSLFLALALALASPAFGSDLFSISADKSAYSLGEMATLHASVSTRPINQDYEFDVVGELNGAPIAVERVTDFEYFSSTPALSEPANTWSATLVIQDKRYARDLKSSITYFHGRIQTLADQINNSTDPEEIADLEAQRDRYASMKAGAESELASIRTPVQTLSLEFTAQ